MFRLGNRIPDKRNALHDSQSCETARRGRFAAQRCRDRRARQPGPFRLLSDSGPTIGGSERLFRANSCRSNRAPSASAFSQCAPQSRQAALGQPKSRLLGAHYGRARPMPRFSKADAMPARRFRRPWVESGSSRPIGSSTGNDHSGRAPNQASDQGLWPCRYANPLRAPFVEHRKATQDLGEDQPGSGVGAHQLGRYLSFGHLEKGFARTV